MQHSGTRALPPEKVQEVVQRLDKVAENMIRGVRAGRAVELLPEVNKLLGQFPKHLGLLQAKVEIQTAQQDYKGAVATAETMVKAAPKQAMAHVLLGSCLMQTFERDRAVEHIKTAARLAHNDLNALSVVSHYLQRTEAAEQSLAVLLRLNELRPNNPHFLQGIAAACRFLGRLEEAEEYCNQAIALEPKDGHAYFVRSDLRKQTPERNHTAELEARLAKGVENQRARVHIQFALAKEYEDLGDADKSFHHLNQVSGFQRGLIEYDVSNDLRTMEEIKHYFGKAFFDRIKPGHPSDAPIFILGMPRTGTTLIERILGSHSKVHSRGELSLIPRLMVTGVRAMIDSNDVPPQDRVKLTSQLDYRAIGEQYLKNLAHRPNNEPHFIDKLPYNFLNVGPIHAALPNSKIIQLDRHPMDTCYSVYKMLFGDAYPFSYKFEELAAYYIGYRRLMDHWHAVLPKGRILKMRYEEMVEDQEGQSKRLLQHCGLAWEDQVSEFYRSNKQASTTASASQVRQPVYKTSVAKWRRYEKHLAPLRDILARNGVEGLD
jgi:tetratricopeptide (TPR) repeat protein